MSNARKIILNVIATYARSLLSFVFGLFTVRWILEALGHSDYGLYGLVGGVMTFISMLNATQSATVARYYAYAIGKVGSGGDASSASQGFELRRLFNTAVAIHLLLPLALIGIGYPMGLYAFHNWLDIPAGRMNACIFVFRCSLAALLVNTLIAPYTAMFIAHQLIRQLVAFSLVNVFGLVGVAYSLLHIHGDRLKWYALMMFGLSASVCLLHVTFARRQFQACRIVLDEMFDWHRTMAILRYTGIKFLGDIAWCARNMGNSFVTNIYFGTLGNAAAGVGGQLSMQAESLCNTLNGAFAPAITTEEGAGRRREMIEMAFRCCKFGSLLLLLVAVPLLVEMDNWLAVWLKHPPEGAGRLCMCFIASSTITYLTKGHQLAIQAHGGIGRWQLFDSLGYLSGIPVSCLFAAMGCGLVSIGYGHIMSICLVSLARLVFARRLVGASIRKWVRSVLLPVVLVWSFSCPATYMASLIAGEGLIGLLAVAAFSVAVTCAAGWILALTKSERMFIVTRFKARLCQWNQ